MVELVKKLLDKGLAYKGDDGSIYFSIKKFPKYGQLSGIDPTKLKAGARVKQDEYSKEGVGDFALWKAWDENDGPVFWNTIFGKGRPGWHIECSCLLYTSDAADDLLCVDLGGRRIIKKKKKKDKKTIANG